MLLIWKDAIYVAHASFSFHFKTAGETLKEKQAPRTAPKTTSSTSRLREFKETVSNMIHNRPSQTNQSSPRRGKDQAEIQSLPKTLPAQARDWEMESTSSESKSSSSSKSRPAWRPKRESLNIDSIFNKGNRKQCGYTQLSPFSEDAGKNVGDVWVEMNCEMYTFSVHCYASILTNIDDGVLRMSLYLYWDKCTFENCEGILNFLLSRSVYFFSEQFNKRHLRASFHLVFLFACTV